MWAALLAPAAWLVSPGAHALLSVEERAPLVMPRAMLLRESLRHFAPARVESDFQQALRQAESAWAASQGDAALQALAPLQRYAPIAELPFVKAQLLMAAIAQHHHNIDMRHHHRAFAQALVHAIGAGASGDSAARALRLVLPSEADAWLLAQREHYRPLGAAGRRVIQGGRDLLVWRVRTRGGIERDLYFDLGPAAPGR